MAVVFWIITYADWLLRGPNLRHGPLPAYTLDSFPGLVSFGQKIAELILITRKEFFQEKSIFIENAEQ